MKSPKFSNSLTQKSPKILKNIIDTTLGGLPTALLKMNSFTGVVQVFFCTFKKYAFCKTSLGDCSHSMLIGKYYIM